MRSFEMRVIRQLVRGEETMSGPPKPRPCCTPTTNACSLCMPLGACLAFRGLEGCVPFLHGSQGCATYMRRYLISHFREPMDIASSSFGEQAVVFGGQANLTEGLLNVIEQYKPALIGVATTCLAETIGDDLGMLLRAFRSTHAAMEGFPAIVPVSTPSYAGTHGEGFWRAARAAVATLAERTERDADLLGICPGMVSPADFRHLREILRAYHVRFVLFPDYSETLDGPSWSDQIQLPPGGTPLRALRRLGDCGGLLTFSTCMPPEALPGGALERWPDIRLTQLPLPVGVAATDRLLAFLGDWAGCSMPTELQTERRRLVDAYVDAHKITAARRVAVFGEPDFVVGMAVFLREIGMLPVLCAAGGPAPRFEAALRAAVPDLPDDARVAADLDFAEIEAAVEACKPELLVGTSKGYGLGRRLGIPLLRAGFPIHDRIGGPRMLHVGYRGAQRLFDAVCNTLLEHDQNRSAVGYAYM